MVADLFHADGRMDGQKDVAKLIVAFRNFANVSKQFLFCAILVRRTKHAVGKMQGVLLLDLEVHVLTTRI